MFIQLDLFDEGIAEAYVIVKKLSNHKIKMYKKCGMKQCSQEILNKPNRHYCWIHIIDCVDNITPLFPLQTQPLKIRA